MCAWDGLKQMIAALPNRRGISLAATVMRIRSQDVDEVFMW
jgi:hypothetical protein